jgi:hypothetical protein
VGIGVLVMMTMILGFTMGVSVMVVMIMMKACRVPLLVIMSLHAESPTGDAPPFTADKTANREGDGQGGQSCLKDFLTDPKVSKSRNGHVAADAGKRVNVQDFHDWEGGSVP